MFVTRTISAANASVCTLQSRLVWILRLWKLCVEASQRKPKKHFLVSKLVCRFAPTHGRASARLPRRLSLPMSIFDNRGTETLHGPARAFSRRHTLRSRLRQGTDQEVGLNRRQKATLKLTEPLCGNLFGMDIDWITVKQKPTTNNKQPTTTTTNAHTHGYAY